MKTLDALKNALRWKAPYGQPVEQISKQTELLCEAQDVYLDRLARVEAENKDLSERLAIIDAFITRHGQDIASIFDRLHRLETKGVDE